jgi:hypothetical protein
MNLENAIKNWLDSLELGLEEMVLAGLALTLAKEFDAQPHTSTAAELRKTVLELQRQVKGQTVEVDPLADLLRR